MRNINLFKVGTTGNCVVEVHPRASGSIQTLRSNFHPVVSFAQHSLSKKMKSSQDSTGRILLKCYLLADYFCLILSSWEMLSNWGILDTMNSG